MVRVVSGQRGPSGQGGPVVKVVRAVLLRMWSEWSREEDGPSGQRSRWSCGQGGSSGTVVKVVRAVLWIWWSEWSRGHGGSSGPVDKVVRGQEWCLAQSGPWSRWPLGYV